MAFTPKPGKETIINDQGKISIIFSDYAESILSEDMETFGSDNFSGFINTIFNNFHDDAKSSVNLCLEKKEQELSELKRKLNKTSISDKALDELKKLFLDEERKKLQETVLELLAKSGQNNRIIYLNTESIDYLTTDCVEGDDCSIYKRPGQYIKCIIEEYALLPFLKRERIIKKEIFTELEHACNDKKLVKIYTVRINKAGRKESTAVYAYPYKIVTNSLGTRSYLACYITSDRYSNSIAKKMVSRVIARLDKVAVQSQNARLTSSEIFEIEKAIKERSIEFLIGDQTEIRVRLTSNGKKTYKNKLTSRPIRNKDKSTENEYVFYCTEEQAFRYFLNFGADAEIISPKSLRDSMKYTYKRAYDWYEEAEKK